MEENKDHWIDCINHIKAETSPDGSGKIKVVNVARKFSCGSPLVRVVLDLCCEKTGRTSYKWNGPEKLKASDYETIIEAYRERQRGYNTELAKRRRMERMSQKAKAVNGFHPAPAQREIDFKDPEPEPEPEPDGGLDIVDMVIELTAKGVDKALVKSIVNRIKK